MVSIDGIGATSSMMEVMLASNLVLKFGSSARGRRRDVGSASSVNQWWSIREAGASRTSGNNWALGYEVYGGGILVGFVSGLLPGGA